MDVLPAFWIATHVLGKVGVHGVWTVNAVLEVDGEIEHACVHHRLVISVGVSGLAGLTLNIVRHFAIMEENLITMKVVAIALKGFQVHVVKRVSTILL